ncbi:facilitated trehalose transporter Tret1-like isoform X1 [Belonocnema kinseyi]|uniref:facilitated trehalose transporter Tret1-like isoform X1 n=1 Tax=Belonocnema kinseyi TaxID=2817044 RepID=UPI00143DB62F|nr:facilitated trehalose transporter Tret1-like isoform X1 [Belonocnema kinseyi]
MQGKKSKNIRSMKDKNQYPDSRDNDYEKVPVEDLTKKVKIVPEKVGNFCLQYVATASVCLFAMAAGGTYSWTSPALPHLKNNNSEIPITEVEGAWIAALIDVGLFTGNILFLFIYSFLGRKNWILMISIPYIIAWLMIVFAKNIITLYISRFITGIAGDFAMALVPMYIGEIADKDIRGILLIGIRIFVNLGHMYVKTAGALFSYNTMNIMMLIIPVLFFAIFFFMPESPYYLLLQNQREKALKTLMMLKGVKIPEIIDSDLKRIEKSVKESQENKKWKFRELFVVKGNRASLFIALVAWTTKYLSGSTSIGAFTQDIFKETEIPLAPEICAMIIAIIGVIMALVATLIIERAGRKLTFLLSGLFSALGLAIVGIFFFMKTCLELNVKSITWLPLLGLIVYEIAFSLGLSYIPFILMGEIFALDVKMPAVLFINTTMSMVLITVKLAFPWVNNLAGTYASFWIYAICTFFGSILYFCIAPETKGKTLEEIQENMHTKKKIKIPSR